MSLISDFKNFIAKGNAFDLAVGVIVGAAFAPVVKSMVEDILMPLVSLPIGAIDFHNLYLPLTPSGMATMKAAILNHAPLLTLEEARKLGSVMSYGNLLTVLVNFFFIMLGVFFLVQIVNRLKRKEEAKPSPAPEPSRESVLLTEIRDALVAKK